MLRLILFLLFLIASVWLGVEMLRHPGYLLLVYKPWMVQMPLWFALIAVLVFLGLFYFLITSIDKLEFLTVRIKSWLHLRSEHKSLNKTQRGMCALIEWRWKKAEKWLLAGVHQSFEPLINYLAAARAAQEQGAFERRDAYLQQAYQAAPKASLAIGLTQAELELEQGRLEQASATLAHLRQEAPRHPRVLKLLEKVYVRSADWKNLQALLPAMRKARLLTPNEFEAFEKNIYCEIFKEANDKRLSEIHALWSQVPRYLQKNPDLVYAYVLQLYRHAPVTANDTSKEIEDLIRKTLKTTYHPGLINLYGKLSFNNLNRQLVLAGAWLKLYGPQPELLLLLGRLCVRVQLWGKAKDYFEKCLAQGPHAETSFEYGKLLEQLGEPTEALQKYKDGLKQSIHE